MKKLISVIKENKSYIFPWVTLIGLLALLASGLTYAYFDYVAGDSDGGSSMRIGATDLDVSLSLSTVNLSNMMPIHDDYKDTQANVFNFTMSNTSKKLSGCVDLYLGINSITPELVSTDFKFELKNNTTNTTTTGNFYVIEDNRLLLKANEDIPKNTTYSYTLRIWYSYNDNVDQSGVMGASFTSKIISIAYGGSCGSVAMSYTSVGTTQFIAPKDGYYKIETYNINGDYASGEILLHTNEKLYLNVSNTSGVPSSVKCFYDNSSRMCATQGSQNQDNSRIMYAYTDLTQSFLSGYAGVNAPVYTDDRTDLSNNTLHPSGKFFLNGNMQFGTDNTTPKIDVTYLGKYKERNAKLNNVRYIKNCTNENTVDSSNAWAEIQAIKNGLNIAYNKTVTGTSPQFETTGLALAYSYIVDGKLTNAVDSYEFGASSGSGNQCVTVDLGKAYDLDEVAVWHVYPDDRIYKDNITYVSSDNSTWTNVIKGKIGTINGERISGYKGTQAPRNSINYKGIDEESGLPMVAIGREEFYVISDTSHNGINYSLLDSSFLNKINYDSSKSILLARYNLSKATGLQTTSTTQSDYAVPFAGSSNSNGYWDPSGSGIDTKYGTYTNYANNIYDKTYVTAPNYSVAFKNNAGNANYSIAYYVEEYINRLGLGSNAEGRLLTLPEAGILISEAENVVYNGQTYWLGSAYDSVNVWNVYDSGYYGDFSNASSSGVRPVVVVDIEDIEGIPNNN